MKFETLIIALVIAGFLYISGPSYAYWAKWVVILGIIAFIISNIGRKKPIAVPRGEVMEPIVIESTRGAPYKIPEELDLWVKPKGKQKKPWWKKVTEKPPIGYVGKKIGQVLGGKKEEKKEE